MRGIRWKGDGCIDEEPFCVLRVGGLRHPLLGKSCRSLSGLKKPGGLVEQASTRRHQLGGFAVISREWEEWLNKETKNVDHWGGFRRVYDVLNLDALVLKDYSRLVSVGRDSNGFVLAACIDCEYE
jgi:hypothetical protein